MKIFYFILLISLFYSNVIHAQIIYDDANKNLEIGDKITFYQDDSDTLSIEEIMLSNNFVPFKSNVHNFGITSTSVWLKISIKNKLDINDIILQINQPIIDEITFYSYNAIRKKHDIIKMGEYQPFRMRKYLIPDYLFDLTIPKDSTKTYYLKIKCKENMQIPIFIGTRISVLNNFIIGDLLSGIYIGIMLVMILYNFFLYISLKDKSYILYVFYIIIILLTQISLQGLTFQLIWPNTPILAIYSPFIFPALVGIVALEFFKEFLHLKKRNILAYKISLILIIPYIFSVLLSILGFFKFSFILVEATASIVSIFMLITAIQIYNNGYSEARFFIIGWSLFLFGICIYVLKDFEVLPYNNFTRYTMQIGSAIETVLLSFALADRINILKKEKEQSQTQALLALQENEKLITEQNIVLENKVEKRTIELKHTNEELNSTLFNLKNTQAQLVSVEKMASLGQLTAGIAHEINNPINFVSANIKPLKMDFDDVFELIKKYESITTEVNLADKLKEIESYKEQINLTYLMTEIESLISVIDDGAKRTSEIVAGLKNFSRLDESDVKIASINEGIQSTLLLLKSAIPRDTTVITELGDIPRIECLPGKLNQVFMNLLINAIYAINKKKTDGDNKLIIKTYELNDHICVSIEDTGIGMTDDVKAKVFEPFFTTKDVGEGTGLGMSIVFKIIESHHAKIEIESEYGVGTKIIIILNKRIDNYLAT
jgi:signal transduction histidine kinase